MTANATTDDLDELARCARDAAAARARLEHAITAAIANGYSLRTIAEHADISHMSVKRRRVALQKQDAPGGRI
jgi:hypothetical protein